MTDNSKDSPQIILGRVPPVTSDNPSFTGDQLNRKGFAERLTNYIDRLREGTVIAVDAPWGEGKTWFGRNWEKMLKERDHEALYLDAFSHDYIEDPFLALSAQILNLLKEGDNLTDGLADKAAAVAKALIPAGTTIAVNIAARWFLGAPDFSEAIRGALAAGADASEPGLSDAIKKKLTHYEKDKASIEAFRSQLAEFCKQQEKPVVFFIDELDRCRPSFAVQTIERIKHFFEVPNLVFVLLINRSQLETAITGAYGAIDSHRYLGKFLSLTFRFPGNDRVPGQEGAQKARYIHAVLSRYHISTPPLGLKRKAPLFPDGLAFIAEVFGLSLRDLEQAIALSVLANPGLLTGGYLALVVGLKIAYPILFRAMREKRLPEFDKAAQILEDWVDRSVKAGQSQGIFMADEVYQYIVWLKLCASSIAREDTTVLLLQQGLLQQENPSITISSDMQDSPSRLFYLSLFIDLAARIECGITIDRP